MNENFDSDEQASPRKETAPNGARRSARPATNGSPGATAAAPIDFWVALDVLARRWHWIILGGCLVAGGFFYLGLNFIKPKFTALAQMQRSEPAVLSEALKPTPMTPETFVGLIRSPELLTKVGNQAVPPIPPERLTKMIKIDPEADSEFVKISLASPDAQQAVDLLNIYVKEAAEFTKEFQTNQIARLANDNLKKQIDKMTSELAALQDQFRHVATPVAISNRVSEIRTVLGDASRLRKANDDLAALREKFTDRHPQVQAKLEEIAEINRKIKDAGTNEPPASASDLSAILLSSQATTPGANAASEAERQLIQIKLLSLEEAKTKLITIQTEAEGILANPSGFAKGFAAANIKTVQRSPLEIKIGAVTVLGGFFGMGISLLFILLVELSDNRLRNSDDVRRVTKLPILTTLGDLEGMSNAERAQWAFRSWTMLQGRLAPDPNHGLVCGVTSSTPGEGRSTWIHMLAEAASLTGFRVLTISTRPTAPAPAEGEPHERLTDLDPEAEAQSQDETANTVPRNKNEPAANPVSTPNGAVEKNGKSNSALANSVLSTPSQVTEKFNGPDSQPMVHIPLPGWVWNLERRKQWREAITQWRSIDNLVILVELPPASVAEAVLLGCNLPNLLWLTESGKADAAETRNQLETLRHARCNLVGAVLNREPSVPFRKRFPRWLDGFATAALFVATATLAMGAQNEVVKPTSEAPVLLAAAAPAPADAAVTDSSNTASTNAGFSIINPAQRAEWQKHLTLGPGDVLNFGLYGQPDLTRTEVSVSPDGTVTYLQAKNIPVTDLTVDELRAKLDQELGQWYRSPRTIVTPVSFRSKRYFMLGKIMTKGVYVLDRPITVLEAIARAHGFENGLIDRNVVDVADFQRAFLMRSGKRYPLNFEKLFQDGDLAQNIAIEPGDYLYFPSTAVKEVYVVGEVRLPGTATWNSGTTIMSAISARGGYTDRAYKMRVLVVRGSLNDPEKIVVNTHAILDGKEPDFKLQPKDVIYVNSRPFIKVEEIADMAITVFLQSLITTWVGVDVVKPVSQ